MGTFALVHGAWHGAWCWERLAPELEALGHRTVTVDLPCDEPEATFTTYADVVVDAVEAEPDDLTLVGHSLAGLTIPLVAARRPVRRLVFLCALIADPGRSLVEQMRSEPDIFTPEYAARRPGPDELGRSRWADYDAARETFYADCQAQDARAAFQRLRPQAQTPYAEPCPLQAIPPVPRTYVVCSDDRIISPAWSRRAARERLDVEPAELPGSHSPFLSRPAELAQLLDGLS